jgi:hypothetical protein
MEGGIYMKDELFGADGHLTKHAIENLNKGCLNDEDNVLALEHIGECEKCASDFADSFDTDKFEEVPLGFEEEVVRKINKKEEDNMQFIFYAFKIGVAACIALAITFSNVFGFVANKQVKIAQINPPKLDAVNSINTGISNFSEKLIKMEVFK